MRVLQVVHGYPPRYNAGSEVYTQMLAQGLAGRHEVHVFTRQEVPYLGFGTCLHENDGPVSLSIVNVHGVRDRYRLDDVDRLFEQELQEFGPDVVHIQHLNHLSTNLVQIAQGHGVPVVFTLHDFWLMCPRGQFIQLFPEHGDEAYALCHGQAHAQCAQRCYQRYFSGDPEQAPADREYWTNWVSCRMRAVRELVPLIDRFIAPSRQLLNRFRKGLGIPDEQLTYLDYGFDLSRLAGRARVPEQEFVFGYIGTHIPSKGVHHLIEAFAEVPGSTKLRIWGRRTIENTRPLEHLCESLPPAIRRRIEWKGEYCNERITSEVFNKLDAVVVPSIWLENSPLVIHEAQQARVPVITADAGGMAEFVQHGVNGLLFRHRDPKSLAEQMRRLAADRSLATALGHRGYLYSPSGDVPSLQDHVEAIENVYQEVSCKHFVGKERL